MAKKNLPSRRGQGKARATLYLRCGRCGNSARFIEIMARERHLVDGNLNYLHLVEGITDHYECSDCGAEVPVQGHGATR